MQSEDAINLPIPLTSIVGREKEIAKIRQQLGSTRLLTLTGIGGGGTTRLALQLGKLLADTFEDGVSQITKILS